MASLRRPAPAAVASALAAILAATAARACTTPVFRYALERWEPDRFELFFFHRGELSADQQAVLKRLQDALAGETAPLNATLRVVDLAGDLRPREQAIWEAQKDAVPPWIVLLFPDRVGPDVVAWFAPAGSQAVQRLVDSPARREVVRRIASGESAVWVFLESGDAGRDAQALKVLQTELADLQKTLKLPAQAPTAWDGFQVPVGPQLKVAFSILRLSRTDPAEEAFVSVLMRTEEDLASRYASQPMAFPIFGRGRCLWALVGKGIAPEHIADSCTLLVGMCSCEVKEQNPGVDLLIAADWLAAFDGAAQAPPVPPNLIVQATAPAASAPAAPPEQAGPAISPLVRNLAVAVGLLVGAVAAAALVLYKRPARA